MTSNNFEKINDKYSKAKYLDIECIIDMTTGYINATKFCASVSNGKKRFDNYIANDRCKNLVKYLEEPDLSGSFISVLIKDNTSSNELRGTYAHSDLLLDIASWILPEAYFKASRIVNNFLVREREEEIRKLIGDKSELVKMLEASDKRREEAEKRAEAMLLKMTLQNEKTHDKLDKTHDTNIMEHLLDNNLRSNVGYLQDLFDKIIEIYSSYKFKFNDDKKYYNSDVIIFKHFKKIIKFFNEFEYFTPNIDKLFDAKFSEYEDELINMNNDYMRELIENEIETYDQRAFILKAIHYIYNGKIITEWTDIMNSEVFNELKSQKLYEENILSLIGKVYNPRLNIEDLIPQELDWVDLKAKDAYDNKDIVPYKIIRLQHLKYLYKYLALNV
jgi:hypothetical protein